jgi:hypothetical protein
LIPAFGAVAKNDFRIAREIERSGVPPVANLRARSAQFSDLARGIHFNFAFSAWEIHFGNNISANLMGKLVPTFWRDVYPEMCWIPVLILVRRKPFRSRLRMDFGKIAFALFRASAIHRGLFSAPTNFL